MLPLKASYIQIHLHEREKIEQLYSKGYTAGRIARELCRSRSTVTREIQRNGYKKADGSWGYKAYMAQALYRERQGKIFRNKKMHAEEPYGRIAQAHYERRVYRRPLRLKYTAVHWRRVYKRGQRFEALSPWHWGRYGERWRKNYNRRRVRDYLWEKLGRCELYKRRRRLAYPYPQYAGVSIGYRYKQYVSYRKAYRQYDKSKDQARPNNSIGYGILWLYPKQAIPFKSPTIPPPVARKAVSFPLPSAKSKAKGRSMSAAGLKRPFFKIPANDLRGKPLFFLKSA